MNFKKYLLLLALATIPYFLTIFHDVIDIDSSQYAEIVREMIESNTFFQLKDNGKNYLDKPVLTFWTIAISYKLFGISNFAYRLPSILITLLSFYSIFRSNNTYLLKQRARYSCQYCLCCCAWRICDGD
jgi:4-amino-4-deoxy-L-arabinose transferase-like glycosyltransferase